MAATIKGRSVIFSGSKWNGFIKEPEGWRVVKIKERPGQPLKAYIRSENGRGRDFAECFVFEDTLELLVLSKNSRQAK